MGQYGWNGCLMVSLNGLNGLIHINGSTSFNVSNVSGGIGASKGLTGFSCFNGLTSKGSKGWNLLYRHTLVLLVQIGLSVMV